MTQPVVIPHEAPEVKVMPEARHGGLKYRLLVDAEGGPTAGLSQGLFYLSEGHVESRHRHGVTETVHVISGHGAVRLEDREIALAPGDTVYIPAGCRHGFAADEEMTILFTFPTDSFAAVDYDFAEGG